VPPVVLQALASERTPLERLEQQEQLAPGQA
jgi:hypothetical protein